MTIKTLLVKQKPAYFCIRRNMVGFFLMFFVPFFLGNTLEKKHEPSEGSGKYTADTLQVKQAKGRIYVSEGATIIDSEGALQHYELVVKKVSQNKKRTSESHQRIASAKKKIQRPTQVKNISPREHYASIPMSKEVLYGFYGSRLVFCTQQHHYQRSIAVLGSYYEYSVFYTDSDDLVSEVRLDFLSISEDFFSVRPPPVSLANSLFI